MRCGKKPQKDPKISDFWNFAAQSPLKTPKSQNFGILNHPKNNRKNGITEFWTNFFLISQIFGILEKMDLKNQ